MVLLMSFQEFLKDYFFKALLETLFMVLIAGILSVIIGVLIGSILFITNRSKNKYIKFFYSVLSFIINVFRSFPFLILVFALVPFTRQIMMIITGVGTSTGTSAAIVPLTVAATPFIAKIIENALKEVPTNIIEAATSLGLSPWQIITKVVIKEASPSIVSGMTLAIVSLIGFSSMVCNFGAGGLGSFVYNYGYINSDTNAMIFGVLSIIVLVQIVQIIGNLIYRRIGEGYEKNN